MPTTPRRTAARVVVESIVLRMPLLPGREGKKKVEVDDIILETPRRTAARVVVESIVLRLVETYVHTTG